VVAGGKLALQAEPHISLNKIYSPGKEYTMSARIEENEEAQEGQADATPARRSPYQYAPDEIGNALSLVDYYGGNILRASKELDIPWGTIKHWVDNPQRLPPGSVNVRERKNEERAQIAEEAADMVIKAVSAEDLLKAGLRDKAIAFGVFTDKAQLLRGEATTVHGTAPGDLYLLLVDRLLAAAQAKGETLDRQTVIERVCEFKPEARKYLLPES
jgi:hypothetical protein